jgi:glycerol-3-phosphate cytidylyltransferase
MAKYKKGLTFGVFDVFHKGHESLLKRAAEMCDHLYVIVSSDDYTYKHKGHVPIHPVEVRLKNVSYFSENYNTFIQDIGQEKRYWVDSCEPDVLIVGDDWTPETYTGEGLGVKVEYLPYTKGISTTDIRKHNDSKRKNKARP